MYFNNRGSEIIKYCEKENKLEELMPIGSSIHPFSVKTYLKYIKYYENINFAQYHNDNYSFKELNAIKVPLFIRWGNNKELINQAEDIYKFLIKLNQSI